MRENIGLYRGKRKDNNEWVEGYFFETNTPVYRAFIITNMSVDVSDNCTDILDFNIIEVIPETVGEYTGLTDKNGKKIWEGDIVKFDDGTIYSVELINGVYRVVDEQGFYFFYIHNYYLCLEVIGNIHDNSEELLKGGAEEWKC